MKKTAEEVVCRSQERRLKAHAAGRFSRAGYALFFVFVVRDTG